MQTEKSYYALAISSAIAAGKAIMEVYGDELEVEIKDNNTPLTIADRKAHLVIVEGLNKTGLPVLSEEGKSISYETRKNWEDFWMVDPLDGTKEFIKRNGEFTVNIALIRDGFPVFGVIYVPVTQALYFGGESFGSFKARGILNSSATLEEYLNNSDHLPDQAESEQYRVIASRSHMSAETEAYVEEIRKNHGEVAILSKGSSLKLCMIAEGMADEYPRFAPTMEWDTAAGQAIVEGAGREIVHYQSLSRLPYNKENLLNDWFIARRK